ncbi:hypothetical protein CAOG_07939 [Capsaspora owczarzaki ATCC 30864]|uniref:hypothetical protein n=1 Tax=Capsaspora owczarzaki (strain ATCC 30864) TaxID=595528 RepID=UPI0003525D8E|nr:hypothetical protein CAOG_07939 [Capsaspora owczarzaki ATCC 30864]|eukprot:XP_004343027.2 hypothetical protein CAOG_07939 [Capsaspora owczarzaki ATCC 30864]
MSQKCQKCHTDVDGDGLKLENGKMFHNHCLTCAECSKSLDGAFYDRDGSYYCPADYVRKFGKYCAKCKLLIDNEGILVSGQDFHASCFTCTHCSNVIKPGDTIVYKNGAPLCSHCGSQCCSSCDLVITSDYLTAFDRKFHSTCFRCAECGCALGTNKFVEFNGKPFCEADIPKVQQAHHDADTDCACCRRPIGQNEAIKALDQHFHSSCFRCDVCKCELSGSFYERNGKNYCERDYQSNHGVSCSHCNLQINGVYLQLEDNKSFHTGCIRCQTCQSPFSEGDKIYLREQKPYCEAHQRA